MCILIVLWLTCSTHLSLLLPADPASCPASYKNPLFCPVALTSSVHTQHTANLHPSNLDRASLNFQYIETQLSPTFPFITYDPINGNYLIVTLNSMIASCVWNMWCDYIVIPCVVINCTLCRLWIIEYTVNSVMSLLTPICSFVHHITDYVMTLAYS